MSTLAIDMPKNISIKFNWMKFPDDGEVAVMLQLVVAGGCNPAMNQFHRL
ncbi:hypothetical protein [Methylobacillus sp.]